MQPPIFGSIFFEVHVSQSVLPCSLLITYKGGAVEATGFHVIPIAWWISLLDNSQKEHQLILRIADVVNLLRVQVCPSHLTA